MESLATSRSIRAIWASGNPISDAGMAAIAKLPMLRSVFLYASAPEFRDDQPHPSITDHGLAYLKQCPDLEHLNVCGSKITDDGLAQLLTNCPKLRKLEIDNTKVTENGLRLIGSFTGLESLRCSGIKIDDKAVEHFRSLSKLREIVGDLALSNAGVEVLATLSNLEKLSLDESSCDDACMDSVAHMPALKELTIQYTGITDEGFSRMAGSLTLEKVQITGTPMTTRCLEALATMPNLKRVGLMSVKPRADGEPVWKQLEQLSFLESQFWLFGCPPLDHDDFAKFAEFRNLESLMIEGNFGRPFTDADIQHLRNLDQLQYLQLENSLITDEGLKVVESLSRLERLKINCLATDQGLEPLVQAPRLRSIFIGSPNISDAAMERVQTENPNLTQLRRLQFRLDGSEVSRSESSDSFWRQGIGEEREQLNALEGTPARPLVVTDWINGEQNTSLDQLKGNVVLLEFWGTWCGPCRARMPDVLKLHHRFADQGLVVVGLHSTTAAEDAAEYITSNKIPWAVGLDDSDQSSVAYSVPHWPSFYLIDRNGVIRIVNPIKSELEDAIKSLLQE